jgi:T-complex protein 1 subunit zeta
MAAAVVEAIQTIYTPTTTSSNGQQQQAQPLDLNRIEILTLPRNAAADSRLVKGLVLDHGNRHPDMPSHLSGGSNGGGGVVYIMTCNLSLEYEQTETQATFVYQTAEEREKLVESERQWLDERCRKIVAFKRSVCDKDGNAKKNSFCIINQKGVDPLSLDMFAKEGILCLRRAKRRNMERLVLAVGGSVILSLEDELTVDMLGQAGSVRVVSYGGDDNKYTFIEDCRPLDHLLEKNDKEGEQYSSAHSLNKSCTLLLQGPNSLTVHQIQDAVKDGLRSVKNAVEDAALIPGGGALELACHEYLMNVVAPATPGKPKVGIQAYAQALLVIPKTLAANSGFDVQEAILAMQEEYRQTTMAAATGEGTKTTASDGATYTIPKLQYDLAVGFSCKTGEPMLSAEEGVWDNVRVKRQSLYLATVLANQLLLVDEVMRAGKQMGRQPPQGGGDDPMMM